MHAQEVGRARRGRAKRGSEGEASVTRVPSLGVQAPATARWGRAAARLTGAGGLRGDEARPSLPGRDSPPPNRGKPGVPQRLGAARGAVVVASPVARMSLPPAAGPPTRSSAREEARLKGTAPRSSRRGRRVRRSECDPCPGVRRSGSAAPGRGAGGARRPALGWP